MSNQQKQNKRKYKTPKLITYGSLVQMTRANTSGSSMDGGVSPEDKDPMGAPSGGSSGGMTMCIGTVSALEEHRWLLADTSSQDSFRKAILAQVNPGDIVLDLGCGTGIHSFFACEAGAAKVYAIDVDSVIEPARVIAEQNGLADRIAFIYGKSTSVELPEKVDLIITNIGFLPTLEYLPGAIERFLKPGGRTLPASISVGFCPIEDSPVLSQQVSQWKDSKFGYSFDDFHRYAQNRPWYDHLSGEEFLAEPEAFPAMSFEAGIEASYRWETEYLITRDATCRALGGWYSFELAPGILMTTQPPMSIAKEIWSNSILPLSQPLDVSAGDRMKLSIAFHRGVNPFDPVWEWQVEHKGSIVSQNSFDGIPVSRDLLEKLSV